MATSVEFIKENDIVELRGKPDFRAPGGVTYGVVREKVAAPGDPKTIDSVIVFEIVSDKVRNRISGPGVRTEKLNDQNIRAYGLTGAASWHVVIDPVGVKIDEDSYFLSRTGTLRGDDINAIRATINEMGGKDYVDMGGTGPLVPTRSVLARLPNRDEDSLPRPYNRSETPKPRRLSKAERGGLPNEGITVDLPLEFAGKVTDLDQQIIDALLQQGITTLRAAKDLASAQDKIHAIAAHLTKANPTIDDAIAQGLIDADIPGLIFVREPINPDSKPITHLKELYDLAQNGGEGFNGYMGLMSPKAKSRLRLIDTAVHAWENYRSVPEKDTTHTIARQIQKAWGQASTEYLNHVRPHLDNNDLTKIVTPESIPDKYFNDGKLVFIFPKIGPK